MAKHRIHSIEFKRQVALDFIAGETLHVLAKRHDISRNLIRIWVKKLEAGAFDEDARAAHLRGALHSASSAKLLTPDEARRASLSTSPSSRSCCGEANLAFKPKAIAATLAA